MKCQGQRELNRESKWGRQELCLALSALACLSGLIPRQSLPLPTPAASHSPHMSCPFPPPALCSQSTPLLESLQKGQLSLIPHILAQLLPDSFTDTPGTPALCLSLSRTFRHWKNSRGQGVRSLPSWSLHSSGTESKLISNQHINLLREAFPFPSRLSPNLMPLLWPPVPLPHCTHHPLL